MPADFQDADHIRRADEVARRWLVFNTVLAVRHDRAVRYGGQDREIIAKLGNDPSMCDFILNAAGELECTIDADGKLLPFAQAIVDARNAEYPRHSKKGKKKWWHFWR
jgi:hypothetical protein